MLGVQADLGHGESESEAERKSREKAECLADPDCVFVEGQPIRRSTGDIIREFAPPEATGVPGQISTPVIGGASGVTSDITGSKTDDKIKENNDALFERCINKAKEDQAYCETAYKSEYATNVRKCYYFEFSILGIGISWKDEHCDKEYQADRDTGISGCLAKFYGNKGVCIDQRILRNNDLYN